MFEFYEEEEAEADAEEQAEMAEVQGPGTMTSRIGCLKGLKNWVATRHLGWLVICWIQCISGGLEHVFFSIYWE